MKHKVGISIVAIVIFLGVAAYFLWAMFGFWIYDPSCYIEEGFAQELLTEMKEKYGIIVPKDATFVKGYNAYHQQDSYVVVVLECTRKVDMDVNNSSDVSEYIRELLSLDERWSDFGVDNNKVASDWFEEMGGLMQYGSKNKEIDYTYISVSFEGDKTVIRLKGYRPSQMFS